MKDRIRSAFSEIHADEALIDKTAACLQNELGNQRPKNRNIALHRLVGAFAAMGVLAVGVFAFSLYFTAAAYVSIDVNPSVELTLNRFDKVIDTYAFNEEGKQVLSRVGVWGKRYDEAAGEILSSIEANGYFMDDILISLTVQTESDGREQRLCSALRRFVDERVLSIQAAAEVEVFPVSAEVWDTAHGCHMSPAKYLALQELLEVDEGATIETYDDSSIRQIRRRTQECRNAHGTESQENRSEPSTINSHGHGKGHGHGYRFYA